METWFWAGMKKHAAQQNWFEPFEEMRVYLELHYECRTQYCKYPKKQTQTRFSLVVFSSSGKPSLDSRSSKLRTSQNSTVCEMFHVSKPTTSENSLTYCDQRTSLLKLLLVSYSRVVVRLEWFEDVCNIIYDLLKPASQKCVGLITNLLCFGIASETRKFPLIGNHIAFITSISSWCLL